MSDKNQPLEEIVLDVRLKMEELNQAREVALKRTRELIGMCAKSIRAIHRQEWESAEAQLAIAKTSAETLIAGTKEHTELYYAGYTQDALKEYVEAELVYALMRQQLLPTPQTLHVEIATWLNGLAEAATELRRRILDLIRLNQLAEAESLLDKMDEIYSILVTFDFSDAVTGGLRRRTDVVRGVLEKTHGDVTSSVRQNQLQQALQRFEDKLQG